MPIGDLDVAVRGFGGVGRALAARLPVEDVRVVAVADSTSTVHDPGGLDVGVLREVKRAEGRLPGDAPLRLEDLVDEGRIDVLVDVGPTDLGPDPDGLALHRACLEQGIAVVTANKGPLARAGADLRRQAQETGVPYRAEATVGGGTPVLSTLRRLRRADRIERIDAVPNGATSHVLDAVQDGTGWDAAVRQARDAGKLEADPALDLEGWDAAAKAAILAQTAWDAEATVDDVDRTGLDGVDASQIRWAAGQGLRTRLVASVTSRAVRVRPADLPADHPLAMHGLGNTYRIRLAEGGDVVFGGPGAGPTPTATALVRDLEAVRRRQVRPRVRSATGLP